MTTPDETLQRLQPAGWRLVPVEPTEAMLDRGHHQIDFDRSHQRTDVLADPSQIDENGVGTTIEEDMRDAWAAMLAAAPSATALRASASIPIARTATDYALEHAEYLAQEAEMFIEAVNLLALCEQQREELDGDEPEGVVDACDHAIESAKESVDDSMRAVRSGVYEFRKRRDRARDRQSRSDEDRRASPAGQEPGRNDAPTPPPSLAIGTPAAPVVKESLTTHNQDAALLDWLANAGTVSISLVIDAPHDGEICVSGDESTGYGKDLRAAIRAAMGAPTPQETKP